MTGSQGRRTLARAIACACLLATISGAGCAAKSRLDPKPEPPPAQIAVEPVPPPPPGPPPPTELDLTLDAARRSESTGDRSAAVRLYEKAAALAPAGEERATIHLALAFRFADPTTPSRDLERAQSELDAAVQDDPTGPRAVQARLLSILLDELIALRTQTADLKAGSESARDETAELRTKLAEKEKELAEIKKILLRDKGKP